MRQILHVFLPAFVTISLFGTSALAQLNSLSSKNNSELRTSKSLSPVSATRQKIDSLQQLTQPGYYATLFAKQKRSTASTTARVAATPCYTYLCGLINGEVVTTRPGEWNDPAIWSVSRIPTTTDIVRVRHQVIVPASYNAQARLVRYDAGGKLLPASGSRLKLGQ